MSKVPVKNAGALMLFIGPPVIVTMFLWFTSVHPISPLAGFLALVLGCIPWWTYLTWRRGPRDEIPILALVCGMYWIYFVLPLFSGEWKPVRFFGRIGEIPEEYITKSIVLVTLGVAAMWSGATLGIGRRFVPRRVPMMTTSVWSLQYLRFLLVAGTVIGMSDSAAFAFGESARQIVLILLTFLPVIAFAILFRLHLRGQGTLLDRTLIAGFLGLHVLQGIASGWLGATAILVVICAAVYISEGKRIPRIAIVGLLAYVLFFQPGKLAFREQYWAQGDDDSIGAPSAEAQAGKFERIQAWFELSLAAWTNALTDPSGDSVSKLLLESQSRLSLLSHTANVVELSPDVVPFQEGKTYSYLFVALVPRIFWPDKPSMSEANRFYQIEYQVTREDEIEGVAIGIGVLTEGYINFGWLGTIGVMFLFGVVIDYIQRTFMAKSSGMLFWGIGVALIPTFIAPEYQAATLFGDLIQRIIFAILLFLPFIRLQRVVGPQDSPTLAPGAELSPSSGLTLGAGSATTEMLVPVEQVSPER